MLWIWSITQLCMPFATSKDHVGSFESKRLKGGVTLTLLGFNVSIGKDFFLLFNIYSNSYFDIWGLRSGVLDVADNHTKTQRNPDNPKITNGPNIPPCDIRIGDSVSPIAHPSWNPAIAIPTALDLSVWGNHLEGITKVNHYSAFLLQQLLKNLVTIIKGSCHIHWHIHYSDHHKTNFVINQCSIPSHHVIHGRKSHSFRHAKQRTYSK